MVKWKQLEIIRMKTVMETWKQHIGEYAMILIL